MQGADAVDGGGVAEAVPRVGVDAVVGDVAVGVVGDRGAVKSAGADEGRRQHRPTYEWLFDEDGGGRRERSTAESTEFTECGGAYSDFVGCVFEQKRRFRGLV